MDRRKKIESLLNRKIDKMVPFQRHWMLYTDDQQRWILKKLRSKEHLRWWYWVDEEIRDRGFYTMPRYYTDGKEMVITSYIEGKSATYRDLNQAVKMINQLAIFHQTAKGLQTPPKHEAAFLFYDRLYERLKRFYRLIRIAKQIPGSLGSMLSQHGTQFYLDGYRVWEKVGRLLQGYVRCDRQHHRVAHRDLASHNWLLDKNGNFWLIDFDTADYDLQLGDLWQMTVRILGEHPWSLEVYQKIVKAYESVYPLKDKEKRILDLLLCFPNEFIRESIGLALNKSGYSSVSLSYLERLITNRQAQSQWIQSLLGR